MTLTKHSEAIQKIRGPVLRGNSDSKGAKVSVVIPCYNYGRYLADAVETVLSQEDVESEVIIVDDASTDDSLAIARAISAKSSQIKVITHPTNLGPVRTFNDGLAFATGEFLVRLDADDMLTPGSLSRAVCVMRKYPKVGLVYGHPLHFSGSALPAAKVVPTSWTIWSGETWLKERCRDAWCVITSPEVVMRHAVVRKVGGQRDLAHTHDMEMWMRLAAYSDVAYVCADQAWHREHPQSLSARKVDTFRDLKERKEAFDTLFQFVSADVSGIEVMKSAAMHAMATQAIEYANRELDRGRFDLPLITNYVEFAKSICSDVEAISGWRDLQSAVLNQKGRSRWMPAPLLRRAGRWWRRVRRQARWHKSGVY